MLHKTDQEFNHPLTYFYKTDLGPCLNLPEWIFLGGMPQQIRLAKARSTAKRRKAKGY